LAGVVVFETGKEGTESDSQGAFRIKKTEGVFSFWHTAYEPLTVVPAKDQTELSVTMANSVGKTWLVPNCKESPRSAWLNLRFAIPKDAKIKVITDADYQKRLIRYPHGKKKEWLVIWEGATVSFGRPTPEDFIDAASYQERSISYEDSKEIGGGGKEDVRGVVKSGGLWRWAGGFGQFAKYWDVSPAAAAYFDEIIDGMCREGSPPVSVNSNSTSNPRSPVH